MLRIALFLLFAGSAVAQTQELRQIMQQAEAAWNRGDLDGFLSWYEDSPETTAMAREVHRGRKPIVELYRQGTRASGMGTLTYSEIEVRPVGDNVAIMLGRITLKPNSRGGRDHSGRFTLVWRRTPSGWKIIHDHSS